MKHLMLIAALLSFAACGKKSSGGPSCADAVEKAVSAMPAGGGDEIKAKLKTIFTKHCTDDKWSADVIKCYATEAKDMASMKACRSKLTPEQQQAVMGEVREVMMSAMGGAGGMGGPPGGGMGGPPPGGPPPGAPEGGAMGGAGGPPAGSAAP